MRVFPIFSYSVLLIKEIKTVFKMATTIELSLSLNVSIKSLAFCRAILYTLSLASHN